jgi:hypothetical protein
MVKLSRDKTNRKSTANKNKSKNSKKKLNVSIISCAELEKRENSIVIKSGK